MAKLYAIGLLFVLGIAVIIGGMKLSDNGNPPTAPDPAPAKLEPVDHALGLCDAWTQKNSKLGMGEITEEHRIVGAKIPVGHGLVEIDYRAKGSGLLMMSECEFTTAGGETVLVKAESRPR